MSGKITVIPLFLMFLLLTFHITTLSADAFVSISPGKLNELAGPPNEFINDTTTGIITIKVIETAGTNLVKYIGWSRGEDFIEGQLKIGLKHEIEKDTDGYFRIDSFKVRKYLNIKKIDVLILFDSLKNQIGHINYEYFPEKERPFIRQLILFLHNDKFECYDEQNRMQYPYSGQNPFYSGIFGGRWTYFSKGEYAVTMLIPPDFRKNKAMPWKGNKYPDTYTKTPVLFVHGLTGKYGAYSKAIIENNETSYWWMQVKYMESYGIYDAWQFYYPYDANIDFIARWLKSDVEFLYQSYKKELNIVTHSMGGLVTMELMTAPYFSAKQRVNKVFLSEPPMHGSLGGNKQYRTSAGRFFQLLGFDRESPGIRDLSYGSDFYYSLHNRKWTSLDEDDRLNDDYFVLVGTSQLNYKLPEYIHREADGQSDGVVAASSASLLDHQIGLATINGNHDDGRGCWSGLNLDRSSKFLAEMASNFFRMNLSDYTDYLSANQIVDSYYDFSSNRLIVKTKRESLNLNQGVFSFRLINDPNENWKHEIGKSSELIILKDPVKKILLLSPRLSNIKKDEKFLSANLLKEISEIYPEFEAFMNRNSYVSDDCLSFYYTKNPVLTENCASDMEEGIYKVIFYFPHKKFAVPLGEFNFEYLKTNLVTFDLCHKFSPFFEMNVSSQFRNYLPSIHAEKDTTFILDTTVAVGQDTKKIIFQLVSPDAYKKNIKLNLEVTNPDGKVVNAKTPTVNWVEEQLAAYQYYIIEMPMAGYWKVAVKGSNLTDSKLYYTLNVHKEREIIPLESQSKNGKYVKENEGKPGGKVKSMFKKVLEPKTEKN